MVKVLSLLFADWKKLLVRGSRPLHQNG